MTVLSIDWYIIDLIRVKGPNVEKGIELMSFRTGNGRMDGRRWKWPRY
jgi:hypothetical protein